MMDAEEARENARREREREEAARRAAAAVKIFSEEEVSSRDHF